MIVTRVYLRWYKSFNTVFDSDSSPKTWEQIGPERFPYISMPLDDLVTTVVGANESGKSHLLSAISKCILGKGVGREGNRGLEIQDICRHCNFDSLEDEVFPSVGVEIKFEGHNSDDSLPALLSGLALPSSSTSGSVTVILNGKQESSEFASLYDAKGTRIGATSGHQWYSYARQRLPDLRYIDAGLKLANEVHIDYLLNAYDSEKWQVGNIYDSTVANEIANEIAKVQIPEETVKCGVLSASLHSIQNRLNNAIIAKPNTLILEKLLFDDILNVKQETLERIRQLASRHRGYVERVVADINQRIAERLDLPTYWAQDRDIHLEVDFKANHFYFQLRDKTGSKFTFNERSSGLQYFLSYYIQSLAHRRANSGRGLVVLMDEPDGFLSAVAQQNLLKVFESLVSTPNGDLGRCQLVYTTHSPFLINRNFPNRIRLVRKGVGSEGTQYVNHSLARRYEPVRSALGIDCAETIFMGATNILLEGASDQKLIVAAIRKFGKPDAIDDTLDLNGVTFVSGNGAPSVKEILRQSKSLDEQKPIFVALLDGDVSGQTTAQQIIEEKLASNDVVKTLSDMKFREIDPQPKVLEELIPRCLLARATVEYLLSAHGERTTEPEFNASINFVDDKICSNLCQFVRMRIGTSEISDVEIRGGIVDAFVNKVLDSDDESIRTEIADFETTMDVLVLGIKKMISCAEARARRATLERNYRLTIEPYLKVYAKNATKNDVSKLLLILLDHCTFAGDDAGRGRTNIILLQELLDNEVTAASQPVNAASWKVRLEKLRSDPFYQAKGGWDKVE